MSGSESDSATANERRVKKSRVALETEHFATLKASYLVHFAEWCKGKKNITQKLPGAVWKSIYKDFIDEQIEICQAKGASFDIDKLPAPRTMKDALKETIGNENTGNADIKGSSKVILQNEEVLAQLKETDGHARRNMIKFRSSLINQNAKSELELKIPSSSKENTPSQGRITKSEMQSRGMEALERIADSIESNRKSTVDALREHTLLVSKKLDFSQSKSNLMTEESKQKQEIYQMEIETKKLQKLILLRDNGLLSQDEFIAKAQAHIKFE
jgi:hypothetical protein